MESISRKWQVSYLIKDNKSENKIWLNEQHRHSFNFKALSHYIVYRIPAYEKYRSYITLENADIRYRGTLGIGCIRFKHGRIRWHTLAYGKDETFLRPCHTIAYERNVREVYEN